MAKKDFTYRGKTLQELQAMSLKQFMELIPSRQRRSLKRGFTDLQKSVMKKMEKGKDNIETHARDMVIIPSMVGKTIKVHKGNGYVDVRVMPEMVGHVLGEFSLTRKNVKHNAPGIGATKSSASVSVK